MIYALRLLDRLELEPEEVVGVNLVLDIAFLEAEICP
jgi:hypothetical protein